MTVLSIKVSIRKKSGNLFNDPCILMPQSDLAKKENIGTSPVVMANKLYWRTNISEFE